MSLLFDPLYAIHVHYSVSQSIWELFEIHLWQTLFKTRGKSISFVSLRYRYEKKHCEGPALIFLALVFAISHLILLAIKWRQRIQIEDNPQPIDPQNNEDIDQNEKQTNEENVEDSVEDSEDREKTDSQQKENQEKSESNRTQNS